MTPNHLTPTQDEFDALKITLAARDKEIERLRKGLKHIYLGLADPTTYALKLLTSKGPD